MTPDELVVSVLEEHRWALAFTCECGWIAPRGVPRMKHSAHIAERIVDALGIEQVGRKTTGSHPHPTRKGIIVMDSAPVYRFKALEEGT